jgi:predicted small metal-binding protein
MGYELRCRDAGAASCGVKITAATEEELKAKAVEHLARRHGVDTPNETILDHLLAVARER